MAKTLMHQLYTEGKSIKEISKITHWSEETVTNMLSQTAKNRYPIELMADKDKEDIKDKYLNGLSTVAIGKEYGITHHKVADILETFEIDRDHNSVRKFTLDEKYFDHIDTPNKAYILGLLFADGHNELKKGTVSISLKEDDKDILERISKELQSNHELEYVPACTKTIRGKLCNISPSYRLVLFSSYMCESLICCGMIPNKSNRIKFPMYLPDNLYSHFVRGYFDGNGCMGFKDLTTWNGKTLILKITSTYDFNLALSKYLKDNINIESKIIMASNNNGITCDLCINKSLQQLKFCEWIYNDAEMFIKRKHDIYVSKCNIKQS